MPNKMKTKDLVLRILEENKGKMISGSDIGCELNITRSGVWRAINSLRNDGYIISGTTNTGYFLRYDNTFISMTRIKKHLKDTEGKYNITVLKEVESTNTFLKEEAMKGAPGGMVVIAEEQTGGRGRLNRVFHSPKETGLYMSILLRPQLAVEKALLVTTGTAVAVAKAIERIAGVEAKIKWVNDIYCNDKKVCGILTEAAMNFENGMTDYVIIGIGVNIAVPREGFPGELKDTAGSVFEENYFSKRRTDLTEEKSRLAAEILNNLSEYAKNFDDPKILDEYKKMSFLIGKEVNVMSVSGKSERAKVLYIDDGAGLVVRTETGEVKVLISGDVSVAIQKEQ